jgi:hypothetical protein
MFTSSTPQMLVLEELAIKIGCLARGIID